MKTDLPTILLQPQRHKRLRAGHPWAFSNEIQMDNAAKALPKGALVHLAASHGEKLGTAFFNAHTLIAARLVERDPAKTIDAAWCAARLQAALALRERLYPGGFYRLIHAEADGLPGLVIDRYGDTLVVQRNAAGIETIWPQLLEAIDAVLAPKTIVLRDDSAARGFEGLPTNAETLRGTAGGPIPLIENGAKFLADATGGQKTGWFYDQRDNRRAVAAVSAGARVLDLYCYAGGFGVLAAIAGAAQVTMVDRSDTALGLARQAAEANGVADRCRFEKAEIFGHLETLTEAGERYDVVVADPPAFAKSRKDVPTALKGYRKVARLSAELVSPGGFLLAASCSHNVTPESFLEETARGISDAGRGGRIIRAAGAAGDHPLHPHLPESAYLKALLFALD
ncbi:MAG: class I SAM-dependent rRNA methyltransferase [Proteobacteria bacterium]|nr:class I SAM-dependent rRNA methyltransferase [Pseudomonadota bacterium]